MSFSIPIFYRYTLNLRTLSLGCSHQPAQLIHVLLHLLLWHYGQHANQSTDSLAPLAVFIYNCRQKRNSITLIITYIISHAVPWVWPLISSSSDFKAFTLKKKYRKEVTCFNCACLISYTSLIFLHTCQYIWVWINILIYTNVMELGF